MLFSSTIFLFYFLPLVLALYYTVGRIGIRLRNGLLLAASLIFYAWGEPKNVLLLLASCLANYLFGLAVAGRRKGFLILAVGFNLGLLFVFKYLNFAVETVNALAGAEILPQTNIALPLGISFFTFQAMSYVIDVYRGDTPVRKNLSDLALYICLFPQLVAGPIVRYNEIQQQLSTRRESLEAVCAGMCRFVGGLGKKLLLANSMGVIADTVFGQTKLWHTQYLVPSALAWVGAAAYMLQIYLDFSAYSDMAIGLGGMFGFSFPENFNYPYMADSMNEFWRRWHMSLTRWFREYLYFPLGGSRTRNADGMVRNLLIVWLCTGIWHGANWTFVFWGLWNFLFVVLERVAGIDQWPRAIWRHGYTLLTVLIGWVLFRSDDLYCFFEYMANLFCLNGNGVFSAEAFMLLRENWLWLATSVLACVSPEDRRRKLPGALYPAAMLALLGVCVLYLVRGGYNPFIYFNF